MAEFEDKNETVTEEAVETTAKVVNEEKIDDDRYYRAHTDSGCKECNSDGSPKNGKGSSKPAKKGSPTAAFTLGILSIIVAESFGLGIAGLVLGIIGIVQGSRARKTDSDDRALAQIGFVLSIIGVVLSAISIISGIVLTGVIFNAIEMFFTGPHSYYWYF